MSRQIHTPECKAYRAKEVFTPTCDCPRSDSSTEIKRLTAQLARANKIIGWMMPYIGTMCPPPNGLYDLNIHCCENTVREADDTKGRPINQRPGIPS